MSFSPTCIFVLLISNSIKILQATSVAENTLQQVHVVFRHGDRNPDKISMYPTDPHINDTWFPNGLSSLTNLGKKQEYELGKSLRKRYDNFLGDLYLSGIQKAMSTSVPRAKMSLQLVLAGLWPPNKQQRFADDLPWQPIDYTYNLFEKDELLGYPFGCKRYMQEYGQVQASDEVQNYLKQNKDKIDYINNKSGLQIKSVFQLALLYFGLYAEEHTNRTLPAWTRTIYPTFLEEATIYNYQMHTATNDMLKVTGGPLVKKVLHEAKDKIKGETSLKIFLYSGHEFNIATILRALKSWKPHVPQYSSHVIFELHKIGSTYGFKIYYQDTKQEEPKLIDISGCGQFCLIEKFELLMADVMPDSSFKC